MSLIKYGGEFRHLVSPSEAADLFAEESRKAEDMYRLDEHEAMKGAKDKRGYMHASEFILRVKRMNPLLFVQQQINFPGEWGFYTDLGKGVLTYLSTFKKGWVPEYSYTIVDARDLVTDEVRGWRTCLVRLLGWGVVSWEQVMREFGDVYGNGGAKWRKQTQRFRNHVTARVADRNRRNQLAPQNSA